MRRMAAPVLVLAGLAACEGARPPDFADQPAAAPATVARIADTRTEALAHRLEVVHAALTAMVTAIAPACREGHIDREHCAQLAASIRPGVVAVLRARMLLDAGDVDGAEEALRTLPPPAGTGVLDQML